MDRPDNSFNPERNKAVIAETIRETEAFFKKSYDFIDQELGERMEAVASYGCYRFNKGDKTPEDYFGKKIMAHLVGEKICEKLRSMEAVNRLNGNSKYQKSILL